MSSDLKDTINDESMKDYLSRIRQLSQLSKKELIKACKHFKLRSSGNKQELIDRLVNIHSGWTNYTQSASKSKQDEKRKKKKKKKKKDKKKKREQKLLKILNGADDDSNAKGSDLTKYKDQILLLRFQCKRIRPH